MLFWRWLYPGIRVKRWLLLFTGGVLLFSLGLALILNAQLLGQLELAVAQFAYGVTGRFFPTPIGGAVLLALGFAVALVAMQQLVRSIVAALLPGNSERLGEMLYRQRQRDRGPKVVAIGGGTGLATLLRGLKEYTTNITAIVTVTDDGGSSGRLRGELGILPPGDIRNCLVALAETEPMMEQLFQYRFDRGSLRGHNFGNLLIGALTEIFGDFELAVRESSRVLAVRGQVLPSTLENAQIFGRFPSGHQVQGESSITRHGLKEPIERVYLEPEDVQALPAALEAIEEADVIILGPGSLYTSILPNLLVPEITAALRQAQGLKLLVVNVMTQPGETTGFSASDHVKVLFDHAGPGILDAVVVNTEAVDSRRLARYHEQGAEPVAFDRTHFEELGLRVITGDLIDEADLVRHDPAALAARILQWAVERGSFDGGRLLDYYILTERLRRNKKSGGQAS